MPGLLSSMFDGGGDASQGSSQTEHAGAHGDTGASPEIAIHSEQSGSYEDMDGTTHEWSNSNDLALHTDVQATFTVAADATHDTIADY